MEGYGLEFPPLVAAIESHRGVNRIIFVGNMAPLSSMLVIPGKKSWSTLLSSCNTSYECELTNKELSIVEGKLIIQASEEELKEG